MSLPLVRTAVLGASTLLALIVLALSAYVLSQFSLLSDGYGFGVFDDYAALGVATAVIHMVTVIPMIVLGMIRDGAFTSMVAVEIGWLSLLWILWIATGGEAANILGLVVAGCGGDSICGASQAIAAFGFLNWAMLMGYVITILTFAIRAAQMGQNVWTSDVKSLRWLQGNTNFEKPNLMSPQLTGATYPPGMPANVGSPVMPQQYPPGMASPVTPQPNYYPQHGPQV